MSILDWKIVWHKFKTMAYIKKIIKTIQRDSPSAYKNNVNICKTILTGLLKI